MLKHINKEDVFSVEYYDKPDGTYPVEEFILNSEIKMQAKIFKMLDLLSERGTELREPYSAPLEDGIFELRIIQGSNIARVLYFFVIGKKIILTNGFIKKTNKTPRKEILLAKSRKDEYLQRSANNDKKLQGNSKSTIKQ